MYVCSLFGIGNLSDHALGMFKANHRCNVYCAALDLEGKVLHNELSSQYPPCHIVPNKEFLMVMVVMLYIEKP